MRTIQLYETKIEAMHLMGLYWGGSQGVQGLPIQTFFWGLVAVAGAHPGRRVRKTLGVQTVAPMLALGCLWWGRA